MLIQTICCDAFREPAFRDTYQKHPKQQTFKINKERGIKMAIRNIREDGDEILRKKCRTVEVVDEKIKELVELCKE